MAALSLLDYEVTGVERDPVAAEAARKATPSARVVVGDANRLPDLVHGPFDGVVCLWQSFGYGPAENAALLGTMADLLRPGGRLVLDIYNRAFLEARTGERTFERAGWSILERSELRGHRLTSTLDYGIEDVFLWEVFTPDELEAVTHGAGLGVVLVCASFDEVVPPWSEHARMQLVFIRV